MKIKFSHRFEKSFALLEILLVAALISFLGYILLKAYFKNPDIDDSTQKSLSQEGIDTSSQKAVLDSTKEKIKDLNQQILDREKQLEDFR